eukprot:TRINITY_DN20862_c0_g1_i1.p1 TRINITY_DN20862_c0_g1~~TRINITY_DN20862_c0_g1_i1.p1  ORF type:complete len:767 (+),score=171.44 TRINITY_DN20862_c0_g1_i1:37-2337(+)
MATMLTLLAGASVSAQAFVPSNAPNMNGEYVLSETPNGKGTSEKFPLNYKDYPGGVEYFDVYSPLITSRYSQVFWTGLEPVKLPQDIVDRYAGKGMAIVGFEADQVRQTPQGDVQVPINVAYNHHFESTMAGAKSKLEKVHFDGPNDPRRTKLESSMGHRLPDDYYLVKDLAPDNSIPTALHFGASNGGEYRKSFHGLPPGYAKVIDSPETFQFTPMQIDTWNRDKMNLTGPTKFVPGPLPKNSLSPTVDALYSGLLECPVTTRIKKQLDMGYVTKESGVCPTPISTAEECFEAARDTLGNENTTFSQTTVSNPKMPAGCYANSDSKNPAKIAVSFNTAAQAMQCGAGNSTTLIGATQSLVRVEVALNIPRQEVAINLVGPSDVWFGVGFNAGAMKDSPWTIVVDGTGNVTERKIADQNPGVQLPPSVTVVSNTINNGLRYVTISRPMKGKTSDYYTFEPSTNAVLPFINAIGSQPTLSYHKYRTPSSLSILPSDDVAGTCVCAAKPIPFGQGKGTFVYQQTNQTADVGEGAVTFNNYCAPKPRSDLLWQKNPTCDARTYVGGQLSCHHMWSLLDADQEIPWVDQPLEYHLKFRFWVQPYNASYHKMIKRVTWGIASPVEYDVPKCDSKTPNCEQQPDGSWVHTIRGTYEESGSLIGAHFHCHAPTCLSMAMYRCDKSIGLNNCNETTGELLCNENPIYGGTGKIRNKTFDEAGYILQPPCLWGDAEFGLEPPPTVTGYILHTVKHSNATFGHHGEMAWQQMHIMP